MLIRSGFSCFYHKLLALLIQCSLFPSGFASPFTFKTKGEANGGLALFRASFDDDNARASFELPTWILQGLEAAQTPPPEKLIVEARYRAQPSPSSSSSGERSGVRRRLMTLSAMNDSGTTIFQINMDLIGPFLCVNVLDELGAVMFSEHSNIACSLTPEVEHHVPDSVRFDDLLSEAVDRSTPDADKMGDSEDPWKIANLRIDPVAGQIEFRLAKDLYTVLRNRTDLFLRPSGLELEDLKPVLVLGHSEISTSDKSSVSIPAFRGEIELKRFGYASSKDASSEVVKTPETVPSETTSVPLSADARLVRVQNIPHYSGSILLKNEEKLLNNGTPSSTETEIVRALPLEAPPIASNERDPDQIAAFELEELIAEQLEQKERAEAPAQGGGAGMHFSSPSSFEGDEPSSHKGIDPVEPGITIEPAANLSDPLLLIPLQKILADQDISGAINDSSDANAFESAHQQQQKRPLTTEQLALEFACRPPEQSQCEQTATRSCIRVHPNASEDLAQLGFLCLCRKGFGGRFCQFSLLPRGCSDAFAHHGLAEAEGLQLIDLDGSSPRLQATWVECSAADGTTIVRHNVPDQVEIRNRSAQGSRPKFYPVVYKLFSPAQLQVLIARSESCRQRVEFTCQNAPILFAENRTWFETVARPGEPLRQLGVREHACACRNPELYGCSKEKQCNCDDVSQPELVQQDQAVLHNETVGVTAIYLRRYLPGQTFEDEEEEENHLGNSAQSSLNLTLGVVECHGEVGTSGSNYVLTFRDASARVATQQTVAAGGWRQLEFDFRTSQRDIPQLFGIYHHDHQKQEEQTKSGQPSEEHLTVEQQHSERFALKLSLVEGDTLTMQLSTLDVVSANKNSSSSVSSENGTTSAEQKPLKPTIRLTVPVRLDDLQWHRVVMERFRGELRLAVDRWNAFHSLSLEAESELVGGGGIDSREVGVGDSSYSPDTTTFVFGGEASSSLPSHDEDSDSESRSGKGFCLAAFRLDDRLIDWFSDASTPLDNSPGAPVLADGCPDLCLAVPPENACEQGGRCVELLHNGSTGCECRDPALHFGARCELNVNSAAGPPIGFFAPQQNRIPSSGSAFIKLESFDSKGAENVKNKNGGGGNLPEGVDSVRPQRHLTFAARMTTSRALLYYAHDARDNFLQIHQADEFRLRLSVNNGTAVVRCTVYAPPGERWDDGNWVQFVVKTLPTDGILQLRIAKDPGTSGGEEPKWHRCSIPLMSLKRNAKAISGTFSGVQDAILPPPHFALISAVSSRKLKSSSSSEEEADGLNTAVLFIGGLPRISAGPRWWSSKRRRRRTASEEVFKKNETASWDSAAQKEKPGNFTNTRRLFQNTRFSSRFSIVGQQQRIAVPYVTDLPGLEGGCFRGLSIDGHLIPLDSAITPQSQKKKPHQTLIQVGCVLDDTEGGGEGNLATTMNRLNCQNGGRQPSPMVGLQQTTTKGSQSKQKKHQQRLAANVACDCRHTSFEGLLCQEDTGLAFDGRSALVFDMAEPKRYFLEESDEEAIRFAFSTTTLAPENNTNGGGKNGEEEIEETSAGGTLFAKSTGTKAKTITDLLAIYFDDGSAFHAFLNENGSLEMEMTDFVGNPLREETPEHVFPGDLADGHRHFFHMRLSAGMAPVMMVSVDNVQRRWWYLASETPLETNGENGSENNNNSSFVHLLEQKEKSRRDSRESPVTLLPRLATARLVFVGGRPTKEQLPEDGGFDAYEDPQSDGGGEETGKAEKSSSPSSENSTDDHQTASDSSNAHHRDEGDGGSPQAMPSVEESVFRRRRRLQQRTLKAKVKTEKRQLFEGANPVSVVPVDTHDGEEQEAVATNGDDSQHQMPSLEEEEGTGEHQHKEAASVSGGAGTNGQQQRNEKNKNGAKRTAIRYTGCISNVDVEFTRGGKSVHFRPIHSLLDPLDYYHRSARIDSKSSNGIITDSKTTNESSSIPSSSNEKKNGEILSPARCSSLPPGTVRFHHPEPQHHRDSSALGDAENAILTDASKKLADDLLPHHHHRDHHQEPLRHPMWEAIFAPIYLPDDTPPPPRKKDPDVPDLAFNRNDFKFSDLFSLDTGFVLLNLIVLLALLLLCVLVCCVCLCCWRRHRRKTRGEADIEHLPGDSSTGAAAVRSRKVWRHRKRQKKEELDSRNRGRRLLLGEDTPEKPLRSILRKPSNGAKANNNNSANNKRNKNNSNFYSESPATQQREAVSVSAASLVPPATGNYNSNEESESFYTSSMEQLAEGCFAERPPDVNSIIGTPARELGQGTNIRASGEFTSMSSSFVE